MQTFKDTEGLTWTIKFTVFLRRKISKAIGVDILTMLDEKTLAKFDEEPELLIDTLWYCIESQANERGIDLEKFLSNHTDQDLLDKVTEKLFDECIEYAPEKKRPSMKKVLKIYRAVGKQASTISMKHIDNTDVNAVVDEVTTQIESLLQVKSTAGKTN